MLSVQLLGPSHPPRVESAVHNSSCSSPTADTDDAPVPSSSLRRSDISESKLLSAKTAGILEIHISVIRHRRILVMISLAEDVHDTGTDGWFTSPHAYGGRAFELPPDLTAQCKMNARKRARVTYHDLASATPHMKKERKGKGDDI